MNKHLTNLKYSLSENRYLYLLSTITFLLIYLSTLNKSYGYFIDEFYYIACADNPAFGYVDHPPLAPLVLAIFKLLFGSSLFAIRFLPALAAAASVFYSGIIVKEISDNKFTHFLAAFSVASMPVTLAFGGFYSMNAFEPLLAVLLLLLTVRMIKTNNTKLWIYSGIIMGLGVMNKHTFGVFIVALLLTLLLSGKWKLLFSKYFFFGGIIGFVIFLPNIIWQVLNDFPSLEFYRNISVDKNVFTPPIDFVMGQIIQMSPSTVPIWLTGTFYLLFSKRFKDYRFLSLLFIGLFIFMMLSGTSRSDRLAFAYPAAFVGGALFFENIFTRFRANWLRPVLIISLAFGVVIALPLILPYFNYETVKSHTEFLGINTEIEIGKKPPLPQLLADRIGWEEKVKLVVSAYNNLSDEDKKLSVIAASNYGQAGAIELYGSEYNVSPVACAHNNYYLWSKERVDGNILLQLDNDDSFEGLQRVFGEVEIYNGIFKNNYVSDHENNLVVFICRNPKIPFSEMLERSKNYH